MNQDPHEVVIPDGVSPGVADIARAFNSGGWQERNEAELSTSAIGRNLQAQLDQLRAEYNAVLLERDQAIQQRDQACALSVELLRDTERLRVVERERDTLREVAQGNKRHVVFLVEENDQLRGQLAELEQEKAAAQQRAAEYRAGGM